MKKVIIFIAVMFAFVAAGFSQTNNEQEKVSDTITNKVVVCDTVKNASTEKDYKCDVERLRKEYNRYQLNTSFGSKVKSDINKVGKKNYSK